MEYKCSRLDSFSDKNSKNLLIILQKCNLIIFLQKIAESRVFFFPEIRFQLLRSESQNFPSSSDRTVPGKFCDSLRNS